LVEKILEKRSAKRQELIIVARVLAVKPKPARVEAFARMKACRSK
jgi:hypothetical protein